MADMDISAGPQATGTDSPVNGPEGVLSLHILRPNIRADLMRYLSEISSSIMSTQNSFPDSAPFRETIDAGISRVASLICQSENFIELVSQAVQENRSAQVHYDASTAGPHNPTFTRLELIRCNHLVIYVDSMLKGARTISTKFDRSQYLVGIAGAVEVKILRILAEERYSSYYSSDSRGETRQKGRVSVADKHVLRSRGVTFVSSEIAATLHALEADSTFLTFCTEDVSGSSEAGEIISFIPNTALYLYTRHPLEPLSMAGFPSSQPTAIDANLAAQTAITNLEASRTYRLLTSEVQLDAFRDAIHFQCARLDDIVGLRPAKMLFPQDMKESVEKIGKYVKALVQHKGRLPLNANHFVDEVRNDDKIVMIRYRLFEGKHVQARLHYFPDCSETYIHNHSKNFISMQLHGSYEHTTHVIDENDTNNNYRERLRAPDGSLAEVVTRRGRLRNEATFVHGLNHIYYLQRETLHTVTVRPGSSTKAITLYVRETFDTGTNVRVVGDIGCAVQSSSDIKLPLEQQAAVLEEIHSLIFETGEVASMTPKLAAEPPLDDCAI